MRGLEHDGTEYAPPQDVVVNSMVNTKPNDGGPRCGQQEDASVCVVLHVTDVTRCAKAGSWHHCEHLGVALSQYTTWISISLS